MDGGGGLTPLGRQLVRKLQSRGVLIDLSHSSDQTAWDILKQTKKPVLASHSNARTLCDVPRNLTDELLRAIGSQGGVVGVNFYTAFLDERVEAEADEIRKCWAPKVKAINERYAADPGRRMAAGRKMAERALRNVRAVPLARVVQHIEHLVRVAGPHAVGLGADFDGMLLTPKGLPDVSAYPTLERALARRYPQPVVRGILGENLLRLLAEVEP